jgi:hypothetical protein
MRRIKPVLLPILWLLLLTGCSAKGLYSLTVITDGQHELARDVPGDLLVLGGAATLAQGAAVAGNVHVLLGELLVLGEIDGDVAFLNGRLHLGPTARVGGDLNLGGGAYSAAPGAVIAGRIDTGAGVALPSAPQRVTSGRWASLARGLVSGLLLGLVAATLARYRPAGARRVGEAATQHALASLAMGALVGLVGVSLLVTMAYTIVLIPVTLLGLASLGVAVLYGWIGLGTEVGRLSARALSRPLRPAAAAFTGTLAVMLVLELASALPAVGGLLAISLALLGLGAAALTRFGLRPFTPAVQN